MHKRIISSALSVSAFTTLAVNAAEVESGQVKQLDTIIVTTTRLDTKLQDVPATVSIITKDRMDELQVNSTEDLIRYEPGISIKRITSGVDPFGNLGSFQIRGVGGNRVQIQVDGSRIQEQIQDGNRNFVDLSTLKAVELVRGPSSVLWGADALGGLVAYQTLDPDDLLKNTSNAFAGQVGLGYDSFDDAFSKSATMAFQLSPTLQGLLMYNHNKAHEGKLKKARADGGIWGCPRGLDAIRCDELNPIYLGCPQPVSGTVAVAVPILSTKTGSHF